MPRTAARLGAISLVLLLWLGLELGPAHALIINAPTLKSYLDASQHIAVAHVETVLPDKPALVLTVAEHLKGKAPFAKLAVNCRGDDEAQKLKHGPELFKRVAPKLPVVLFIHEADETVIVFAYTNGTWIQLKGVKDGGDLRWSFTHLEPVLRQTFKGTTAEMTQTVRDALAGKKEPPGIDKKEKPGFGPEVAREGPPQGRLPGTHAGPPFAVIPSILVGGPLALLALMFPALFDGWRRWLALISVAGTNATVFSLHWLFAVWLDGTWCGSPTALWLALTLVTAAGCFGAWWAHLGRVQRGEAPAAPGRVERRILIGIAAAGAAFLAVLAWLRQPLLATEWQPVWVFAAGAGAAALFAFAARGFGTARRPALSSETVMLSAMLLVSVAFGALNAPVRARTPLALPVVAENAGPRRPTLAWMFRPADTGWFHATPCVHGDRVYAAAAHDHPFTPYGAVYCVDRATGQLLWTFHDGKKMKQVYSSPVVAGGLLYVGEGLHHHTGCKLYCLDAATGEKKWELATQSHTEGTPVVADGRVYFGAGDDGVYCLDALTGKEVWHVGGLHVDSTPAVVDGRVYCGAGVGDIFRETCVFCLDAADGAVKWRVPTELPAWGCPTVADGRVYFGTGQAPAYAGGDDPRGLLLCLDAAAGTPVWQRSCQGSVMCKPAVDDRYAYFGSFDRSFRCAARETGLTVWKHELGGPVMAAPAFTVWPGSRVPADLVVGTFTGQFYSLEPATGRPRWELSLSEASQSIPEFHASPALAHRPDGRGVARQIFLAVTMQSSAKVPVLCCYEDRLEPEADE